MDAILQDGDIVELDGRVVEGYERATFLRFEPTLVVGICPKRICTNGDVLDTGRVRIQRGRTNSDIVRAGSERRHGALADTDVPDTNGQRR